MKGPLPLLGFLLLLLAIDSAAAQDKKTSAEPKPVQKLTVRLLDTEKKPVSGAHVGSFAYFGQKTLKPEIADAAGLMYVDHCVSDKDGLAQIGSKDDDLRDYRGRVGVIARHAGRGLIAFADVDSAHLTTPMEMTLVPECRVFGKVVSPELAKLGRKVGWTNVYLNIDSKRMMSCDSEPDGDVHFLVPPGRYNLHAYGTYLGPKDVSITVPSGKRETELRLTLVANRFALLRGLPAPELRDIVAWKNSAPLKLADLKGKCVLLDFWGHWCGPCVYQMPRTFDLYDRFAKQGLVVIGVHVEFTEANVDSVEKLDAKLTSVRKTVWHGRDIPYPVAIVRPQGRRSAVSDDYGIHGYPGHLLIDRGGNVVDLMGTEAGGVALLQKYLDQKPADKAPRSDRR
jgi:thiol-disulfide isomerase/thioredoxin